MEGRKDGVVLRDLGIGIQGPRVALRMDGERSGLERGDIKREREVQRTVDKGPGTRVCRDGGGRTHRLSGGQGVGINRFHGGEAEEGPKAHGFTRKGVRSHQRTLT